MTEPPHHPAPAVLDLSRFDAAGAAVVAYLEKVAPSTAWAVTRVADDSQIFLRTSANSLGIAEGLISGWGPSLCRRMTDGTIPSVVEDIEEAGLPLIGVPGHDPVRAYVGVPIKRADGSLFGTVCGYGSEPFGDSLPEAATALLGLLSSLLTTVYETDHARSMAERSAELARRDAETDPLTGLVNRRGWNRVIEPEDRRWHRFGDPGAVVVVDLDDMKTVNDRFGHAAGDRMIIGAADLLLDWADDSDVVSRLGGDEFGIIMYGRAAAEVAEMLGELVSSATTSGVTMSVGWSSVTDTGSVAASWAAADANMYICKRRSAGTSRVDIHPAPHNRASLRPPA